MLIPRSVLVILACNPVRTRVCLTLGNWKIVVMSKKVQHNMACHINANHIMLLPYIYTLYINYLACVYLIYEYELRLGKYYQGQKSSACFIPQLKMLWRGEWAESPTKGKTWVFQIKSRTLHREAPQLRDDPNLRTMLKSMILEALAEHFKAASQNFDCEKGQNKRHRNNSWTHKESARAHISDAEYELKEWAGRCVHNTSDWGEHTGQSRRCVHNTSDRGEHTGQPRKCVHYTLDWGEHTGQSRFMRSLTRSMNQGRTMSFSSA